MAYDVTSITTAIAEGKVDETQARQLISEYYNWEIKVAQLLNPGDAAQATTESVADQPAPETQEETPAADLTQEEDKPAE